MNLFRKVKSLMCGNNTPERKLYQKLMSPEYKTDDYFWKDHDENMETVNTLFEDYWKPRLLVDHNSKCAYEFMDENARLVGVDNADIDWISLKKIPQDALYRVKIRNAYFPTAIRGYRNNVAQVSWQLIPDGRYWMDDDGFGMTDDEKVEIYAYIDRTGKAVVPYQIFKSGKQADMLLKKLRK